eukprot:821617-Pleurochrysis_carterae.AAC.2
MIAICVPPQQGSVRSHRTVITDSATHMRDTSFRPPGEPMKTKRGVECECSKRLLKAFTSW